MKWADYPGVSIAQRPANPERGKTRLQLFKFGLSLQTPATNQYI